MDVDERSGSSAADASNRRASPRLPVEGQATLLLLKNELRIPCRVADLSMGGCRIQTEKAFQVRPPARVEVSFTVRGLVFRFNGITQWTDGKRHVGIRFDAMIARRRTELAEILTELAELQAAKEAREAQEEQAARKRAEAVEQAEREALAEVPPSLNPSVPEVSGDATGPSNEASPAIDKPVTAGTKRERRAQARFEVESSAVIYCVRTGLTLRGSIQDLSLGGCCIRIDERFQMGIYTRVEVEFVIEHEPFRLGGVTQSIHGEQQVGIRFIDLSERKRWQIGQLIEEIKARQAKQVDRPPVPKEGALGA